MGIKELESSIREVGRKESQQLLQEAKAEAKKITQQHEKEAAARYGKLQKELRNEAELVGRRILASHKLKAKEIVEDKKNEMIDRIFELAKKDILGAGAAEQKRLMKALAENGKKLIDSPVVYADRKHAKLLTDAKTADLGDFGVVVRSSKSSAEIDNTLSSRMTELNTLLRHEVAEVLFDE